MQETPFSILPDDLVLNIFLKVEDDPRHWACLACVCTKFSALIRNICWKNKCLDTIPSIVSDLLTPLGVPPGGWNALHKLCVCCPGLFRAGVLLENSDFGLERELGPHEDFQSNGSSSNPIVESHPNTSTSATSTQCGHSGSDGWSLYDDLYFDTMYDVSESQDNPQADAYVVDGLVVKVGRDVVISNPREKKCRLEGTHLASGVWNLSREQGNKLLASRFRGDCLYICDWPGCLHTEEKRNYMLFRGIFKNFKRSQVWRTINDGKSRSKVSLDCAFCSCRETWDMHSAFCLRRLYGYHDDGEPVVRAYVCENGHVSGAWTERPMYT
ncbi:hypothetical protein GIB67_039428 [Kingdonia uniflora]|uniref:Phytochrome A-associated F-box protein n=1 Tax=Kingdonia uniflora TaxID=39325 RepID=A0A7J7LIW7_9MAGN|nr:hypothetical protein GIB67_039428 [Kingdonia uniflora]